MLYLWAFYILCGKGNRLTVNASRNLMSPAFLPVLSSWGCVLIQWPERPTGAGNRHTRQPTSWASCQLSSTCWLPDLAFCLPWQVPLLGLLYEKGKKAQGMGERIALLGVLSHAGPTCLSQLFSHAASAERHIVPAWYLFKEINLYFPPRMGNRQAKYMITERREGKLPLVLRSCYSPNKVSMETHNHLRVY